MPPSERIVSQASVRIRYVTKNGGDHEQEEQVLPASAAERDPVRERVADRERRHGRDPRVLERADELRLVRRDGVAEVRPRPAEGEATGRGPARGPSSRGSTSARRRRRRATPCPARRKVRRRPAARWKNLPIPPGLGSDQVLEVLLVLRVVEPPWRRTRASSRAVTPAGRSAGSSPPPGRSSSARPPAPFDRADVVDVVLDLARRSSGRRTSSRAPRRRRRRRPSGSACCRSRASPRSSARSTSGPDGRPGAAPCRPTRRSTPRRRPWPAAARSRCP